MDKRQEDLLKAIVETYVKTVKPVGSKSLCQKFKLSSATIRNEMAVLESLGYIFPLVEFPVKVVIDTM